MKPEIPVFFATDDNYAPMLGVTLKSMFDYASSDYFYNIYILSTSLSVDCQEKLSKNIPDNAAITVVSLQAELDKVSEKLHLRDYYSKETYYRFFIANLFPQYDKVLYLDCDIVILEDISKLYNVELGDNFVAAIQEEVMATNKVFGDYVEKALGIPCENYFNAGILLINTYLFRKENIEDQFVELLNHFIFRVTQDQDYLNVLCKDRVKLLDLGWNKTAFKNDDFDDKDLKLVHYKMSYKPWLYDDVLYGEYFWKYAEQTNFYETILEKKSLHTRFDKLRDKIAYERLILKAIRDTYDQNNYYSVTSRNKQKEIVEV